MKLFRSLSALQKVVLWMSTLLAGLALSYPMPASYRWNNEAWVRDLRVPDPSTEHRHFLLDYDRYGRVRPNTGRACFEAIGILTLGIALMLALNGVSTPRPSVTSVLVIGGVCAAGMWLSGIAAAIDDLSKTSKYLQRTVSDIEGNISSIEIDVSSIEQDLSSVRAEVVYGRRY